MFTSKLISEHYKKFSLAKGNEHIASEYAISKIQELIKMFGISRIIEIGLGIGSIAGTLLDINKDLKYAGTEANSFCLNALLENLGVAYQRIEIFRNLETIPRERKFDLVIIDGKDVGLQMLKGLITERGIIVIEGDRMSQQELILELFPKHKYVHSISQVKNKSYSPFPEDHWQGGIKIIFTDPTIKQKIWWLKEKIYTKFKYELR